MNRAAHAVDGCELFASACLKGRNFAVHGRVVVEQVIVFQKIGLIGHDLLHAERPLLVPRARKAQCFVPCWQLNRTSTSVFRQSHSQHFDQNAVDVVFWLLLGQAERVHLNTIAEAAHFGVFDAIALLADFVPKFDERPHFAHFGHEADASIHEERDAANHVGEVLCWNLALKIIENSSRGCQCKGQFFFGCRASLLKVVGTDVHRVPFGQVFAGIGRNVRDHPQGWLRRTNVGAARKILFDNVVLNRALKRRHIGALLLCYGDIQGQQPRSRRVDCHRRIHLFERDIVEQRAHVTEVADRNANFAHFTASEAMI